jgi:hypothetical protein
MSLMCMQSRSEIVLYMLLNYTSVHQRTQISQYRIRAGCTQDGNNDKLGIVISDKDCPTARVMDGVHRQLTLWTRTGAEIKRKNFKYKTRKAAPRARAPPARPAVIPRGPSARHPTAASKASLRRRAQDEAAAVASAARPARPPRAVPDPAAAAAAKEARAKAAVKSREARKLAAKVEIEDTEEEEEEEEELEMEEEDVSPGAAVLDDPAVRCLALGVDGLA